MRVSRTLTALTLLALASPVAMAVDLPEIWQAALRHDRELAVARAAQAGAGARRDQAAALWRPTIGASVSAGLGGSDTAVRGARFSAPGFGTSAGVAFDTSVNQGPVSRIALSATQALYNPERRAQQRQLLLSADMADLEFDAASDALLLRTTERYYELALAEEHLRVLTLRMQAVQQAATQAQDRFDLGALPVTGVHEARANLASVRAQVAAVSAELAVRRSQLANSTGLPDAALSARLPESAFLEEPAAGLDDWLRDADARNPGLRIARLAVDVARQEADKFSARAAPTVDLVAQASHERVHGNGDFGDASSAASRRMLGVSASIPLYTGGYREARAEEAARLVDRALAESERARERLAQQVRSLWLSLSAGAQRVRALSEGEVAAAARADATRTGLSVGHRSTQDLLDAEADLAAMRYSLAQARVGLVLDRWRLASLAGRLDASRLRAPGAG